MKTFRRVIVWFAVICCVTVVSLLFEKPRDAALAFLFIIDMATPEASELYQVVTDDIVVTHDSLDRESKKTLYYSIYSPPGNHKKSAIIMAHGFTEKGNNDRRLQRMAHRMARAGFIVMTPEFPMMRRFRISMEDADNTMEAFRIVKQRPDVDSSSIGLMGFSYGAGPVIMALSDSSIRDQVRFGVIFGGYFDIRKTLKYTLTGYYTTDTGQEMRSVSKNNDRWKFLLGNIPESGNEKSLVIFKSIIAQKITDAGYDPGKNFLSLDSTHQSLYRFIENQNPSAFDVLYAALPNDFRSKLELADLTSYAHLIHSYMIIGHSDQDRVVPYTESLALAKNLTSAPAPFVAVTNLFTHVNLKIEWGSLTVIFTETIPGFFRLWKMTYHIMRMRHTPTVT